jgi:predicted RNase H-like nuclease
VSQLPAAEVVGVDGCPGGWVAILLRGRAAAGAGFFAAGFADLLATIPTGALVAVDIPIGLPERGWRKADAAARQFLRGQASSVFSTPPRPVVEAPNYQEANRRCRELTGQGLSRQAFALAAKILDVDRSRAEVGARLYEVHPEVSFRALATTPLQAGKRTWTGHMQRRALLEQAGIVVPADLGAAGRMAGVDDVLDAAVAAWSAQRIAAGIARSLPDPPERDAEGRAVAIWY